MAAPNLVRLSLIRYDDFLNDIDCFSGQVLIFVTRRGHELSSFGLIPDISIVSDSSVIMSRYLSHSSELLTTSVFFLVNVVYQREYLWNFYLDSIICDSSSSVCSSSAIIIKLAANHEKIELNQSLLIGTGWVMYIGANFNISFRGSSSKRYSVEYFDEKLLWYTILSGDVWGGEGGTEEILFRLELMWGTESRFDLDAAWWSSWTVGIDRRRTSTNFFSGITVPSSCKNISTTAEKDAL